MLNVALLSSMLFHSLYFAIVCISIFLLIYKNLCYAITCVFIFYFLLMACYSLHFIRCYLYYAKACAFLLNACYSLCFFTLNAFIWLVFYNIVGYVMIQLVLILSMPYYSLCFSLQFLYSLWIIPYFFSFKNICLGLR